MRRLLLTLITIIAPPLAAQRIIPIAIETSLGTIDAELDSTHAPITVANFLRYVDSHRYDNGSFFRTVTMANQADKPIKIEVIQGGIPRGHKELEFAPIALERTSVTGLKHHDGTLSMARSGPNSATDEFFVCIGEQPELDFGGKRNADGQGFAAFGRVTKGMDIVRKIQVQPAQAQILVAPITIIRIVRR
ncbi:MAG TPA: peptidylprolyl isomerase [Gemmatimonadales bacterium]|nr:peptidylprolyl isomerase [Gemmatimonadales bacterium]